ncbi:hypothetical protein DFH11DRAFT_1629616 [Phellopilus nigrolimitatus]|nr:hypothetical protein DFH11DRAFT_1629616 [Phellopilus nigrolimitatus]
MSKASTVNPNRRKPARRLVLHVGLLVHTTSTLRISIITQSLIVDTRSCLCIDYNRRSSRPLLLTENNMGPPNYCF